MRLALISRRTRCTDRIASELEGYSYSCQGLGLTNQSTSTHHAKDHHERGEARWAPVKELVSYSLPAASVGRTLITNHSAGTNKQAAVKRGAA